MYIQLCKTRLTIDTQNIYFRPSMIVSIIIIKRDYNNKSSK